MPIGLLIESEEQLIDLLKDSKIKKEKFLVLGGGSNLLFRGNYCGIVIHPVMEHIEVKDESTEFIEVVAGAGVNWDTFVEYCVKREYGGLENLSYIPGNVGASPIQNIGAYGVEVKESIKSVRAIEIETGCIKIFKNKECRFGYRNSIFKNDLKGKYIITEVTFLLKKDSELNLSYGKIKDRMKMKGEPDIMKLREAIIEIRKEKLPEPLELGNAGSFFKNPVVTIDIFNSLQKEFTGLHGYPSGNNMIKIPAGQPKTYKRGYSAVLFCR